MARLDRAIGINMMWTATTRSSRVMTRGGMGSIMMRAA
jgi:hypothetical protein